jgi:hypothetical protein
LGSLGESRGQGREFHKVGLGELRGRSPGARVVIKFDP